MEILPWHEPKAMDVDHVVWKTEIVKSFWLFWNFKISWREGRIFLVSLWTFLFVGKGSSKNLPQKIPLIAIP